MALPIAATPTLEGEDAERFYRELEENEGKQMPDEEFRRICEVFEGVAKKNPWVRGGVGNAAN